ncbi:TPA: signal peptidase I [Streptococcus equi subsp. zooepidemicus]|nr:signal peptidase I [Streptococcus equi subsp. zooepidemicus]HEL0713073.1 signal peptidase I [Streptococcus equi subsp. zooepidemicus]HEL0736986.1 signal peptidase I [Streptococcus equi subsp. zooepidemicus]HEL0767382.1 signal peptidase I [Streptococcus equi subsp. zooepidemicus]HEL1301460.1 signal peptidase I [Streptococcus equi subsp. zooepidemicus]
MVKRDFIRNILLLLILIVGAVLLRIFVFSTYRVTSEASNAYLNKGDLITIKKNIEPKYKDFVVYTVDKKDYVSRVIAVAGDRVTYMDDIFYLNNMVESQSYLESMKAKYLNHAPIGTLYTDDFTISTVTSGKYDSIPKGKYLLLNDNRKNHHDSRQFGLIDVSQIKGLVTFRVLPLKDFGFVEVE